MKKILLMGLSLCLVTAASAQLNGMLKGKAEQLLNKRKKENTQAPADSTSASDPVNTSTNEASSENASKGGGGFMGMFQPATRQDIQDSYTFSDNIVSEAYSVSKSGEKSDVYPYRYLFSNSDFLGMEMPTDLKSPDENRMLMVVEPAKNQTTMYMTSQGKKQVIASKNSVETSNDEKKEDEMTFTKTGQMKDILGYACEEWVGTDKEGNRTQIWVTSGVEIKMFEALKKLSEASKKKSKSQEVKNAPQGFPMEMITTNKDGDQSFWKVTEVNASKPFTVTTSEWEYVGM